MSTIKPLDIYVGDVKVFPDVDLSALGSPIVQSDTFEEMMTWYNMESREKAADARVLYENEYGWTRYVTPIFMPVVEESDDSPWHTKETMNSNFWDFREMGTLYEVPFAIDPKWLRNDRYGSQAFIMCDKIKTLSFDPNKPAAPFIMKDDQGNVVLKTEASLGALFCRCENLRSITGLVINDIQDFTFDTSYIQNDATLYYDDNNAFAGQAEGVGDVNEFRIDTYTGMFQECIKLTTLDVTFPSVMHTNDIGNMFFYCASLPDDQFPTLNLVPLNPNRNISMNAAFYRCPLLAHVPITAASWQYIDNAEAAFGDTTFLHTVDIPANAPHLNNIRNILPPHFDGSNPDTLIIRTESLMTKYKNQEITDASQLMAFNPADVYDSNPDWQLYFNMYVPDSQYQDWVDFFNNITDTERGQGTWFSDSYLHRVSEYNM